MYKFTVKLIIASLLLIPLYYFSKEILWNAVKISWFLSYYYLVLVLLISPIVYIFYKIKFLKKYANLLTSFRRPIGIIAWLLAIFHGFKFEERVYFMWEKYYSSKSSFVEFLYNSIFYSYNWTILGMNTYSFWFWLIWIILMFVLLITSNDFSQKILGAKIWKKLQKLVYPLFIITVLHIYFVWWWKWLYLYPAIILILIRFYVIFDKNFAYKWSTHDTLSWYRKFLCLPCWYIYDEELWDPDWWLLPWTKFEEIPDNWVCPVCLVTKKDFIPLDWHYNPKHLEDHELDFELKSKKYLTEDVVELVFYCDKDLEIKSGQFCNLIFSNDNEENKVTRSYSVIKYIDNYVYFWIKLKEGGKWSDEIKKLEEWMQIKALWPFWDFVLKNTSNKKIFVATWTWLSPIYHMIEKSWYIDKELYFWAQKEKDLFYLKELEKIPNLKINIYLSREDGTFYNYWRISFDKINFDSNAEVYMCWSPALIESLNEDFKKTWNEKIYFEKFL